MTAKRFSGSDSPRRPAPMAVNASSTEVSLKLAMSLASSTNLFDMPTASSCPTPSAWNTAPKVVALSIACDCACPKLSANPAAHCSTPFEYFPKTASDFEIISCRDDAAASAFLNPATTSPMENAPAIMPLTLPANCFVCPRMESRPLLKGCVSAPNTHFIMACLLFL